MFSVSFMDVVPARAPGPGRQGRAEQCPGGARGAPLIRADATPVCSEQLGTGLEQAAPCAIPSFSQSLPGTAKLTDLPSEESNSFPSAPRNAKHRFKCFPFIGRVRVAFLASEVAVVQGGVREKQL